MILILGEPADPHIRKVSRHLRAWRERHTVVDPFERVFLPDLHLSPEDPGRGRLPYRAIWDRLKPFAPGTLDERAQYVIRERSSAVRSLQLLHASGARLMNHPLSTERARSKALQLATASRLGLRIPRTYIGNHPQKVCRFVDSCEGGAIAKSLTWFAGLNGKFFFTRRVTSSQLASSSAAIALSPLVYQEYIPKEHELRVTCVGARLFAARIFSQENDRARVDWRRDQFNLRYEKARLPADWKKRIRAVQSALQLEYAAFDFIVAPGEELVFLEVNAGGNWMWLEDRLGLPIALEVARRLTGHR